MSQTCQELTSTAIGSQSLEFNWAVRPHPKWSEPTVVKCHFGNKGRKSAYDEVKIAIAAAGHLAPSDHQTMYAAPTIWSSMKVLITQRVTWWGSCRRVPRKNPATTTRV